MFKVATVLAALVACVACVPIFVPTGDAEVKDLFIRFMDKHSKSYTHEEFLPRFNIFRANIDRINALNAESDDAIYDINRFADLTYDEFAAIHLRSKPVHDETAEVAVSSGVAALPTTLDWRTDGAVTAVKDQGQCGGCWAFSAVEAVESAAIIAGQGTASTAIFSPQQVIDCDTVDEGCNGGDTPTAYAYMFKAGGLMAEVAYPFKGVDGTCKFLASKVVSRPKAFKYATTGLNETLLMENLAALGPLSICVDASDAWQFYTSGTLKHTSCKSAYDDLNHCVQVVGYSHTTSPGFWLVRNSWGTSWGLSGYIQLEYGQDTCGIAQEATAVSF